MVTTRPLRDDKQLPSPNLPPMHVKLGETVRKPVIIAVCLPTSFHSRINLI
ncbi:hypothetical protein PENSTE_c011G05735 [Penicillium steckii]|uniref:Uncharacterized protein n=1 Tax=Penicillium steckii TaxID=303698 RepID=A0A1V6T7B6_9EURO|nr:hypothetical protein PENSTE_c011G05735 [Penicillium steckii]